MVDFNEHSPCQELLMMIIFFPNFTQPKNNKINKNIKKFNNKKNRVIQTLRLKILKKIIIKQTVVVVTLILMKMEKKLK